MLLKRRPWRLRARIIAWSFFPTTLILLAVALTTFYAYQHVTEDLVIGRNQELARLSAGQLSSGFEEYSRLLENIARTPGLYDGDTPQQRQALLYAANRLVVFDGGVLVLSPQGRVVASQPERPDLMGQDWSAKPFFGQLLRSNAPVFSDITADGPEGADVIMVAVPIIGAMGEERGTLVGMFRLGASTVSAFYGSIVRLRIDDTGTTYIVDGSGRLIYSTGNERIGENISTQPAVQQVLGNKVGYLRTRDLQGRDIMASYAPIPGTPWGLITEDTWATLMSPSQNYRLFLIVLLALGVIVPTFVVMLGMGRITGPIQQLIAGAQDVAGGHFGQTVSVHTGDELEELAQQFNAMSAQLAESYANLEARVASRTRELATLNAIAEVVSQSLDLEETQASAVDKILELMHMDIGAAYGMAADGQTLVLMVQRGVSEINMPWVERIPPDMGAAQQAAREGRPVVRVVDDYPESDLKELLLREGIRQVVSTPLIAKGRPVGAITLGSRDQREFTAEELSLLAAIGQQVGLAVENARLYEHAEQSAVEAERNRLARELHDAVSQTLFSASLTADVLPRIYERNPQEALKRLEKLRQLTRGALAEMRTLLLELRPAALTEAALGDLLQQLATAITGRARVPVTVTLEGDCPHLPPDVQLAFYRIAQESLNNIARHAEASQAAVSLRCEPDPLTGETRLTLTIRDDGRGFDLATVPADHLGLGIMRERARSVGADLMVESRAGEGAQITVVWPAGPKE